MDDNIKLSKQQIQFMEKVNKCIEYTYSPFEINIAMYLCENNLIHTYTKASDLSYCRLTEFGKAYLYDRKIKNRRWRIPIIISSIALIVSIVSIALSPFFTAFFTKLYGL